MILFNVRRVDVPLIVITILLYGMISSRIYNSEFWLVEHKI